MRFILEDWSLLGWSAVLLGEWFLMFCRNVVPFLTLQMKALWSYKTSGMNYTMVQRHLSVESSATLLYEPSDSQTVSVTTANHLLLFRNNHCIVIIIQNTNTLCARNAEFLHIRVDGAYSHHRAWIKGWFWQTSVVSVLNFEHPRQTLLG